MMAALDESGRMYEAKLGATSNILISTQHSFYRPHTDLILPSGYREAVKRRRDKKRFKDLKSHYEISQVELLLPFSNFSVLHLVQVNFNITLSGMNLCMFNNSLNQHDINEPM